MLLGISSNLVFVTYMPELVEQSMSKINKFNDSNMNDLISGIFTACFCVGFMIAPIMSGLLTYYKDFEYTCNFMCLTDMGLALCFLFVFIV